jgi:biopolymer transport protein ExbD
MPLKTHLDDQPTLNLTSMIDVVFLLIIFFMASTEFAEMERQVNVEVPRVSQVGALTSAPEKRVINVYRDGTIVMDQRAVTLEELAQRLSAARAEYADLGVVVRGDAAGPLQNVASVLSACRDAGVSDMGIAVRWNQTRR